MPDIPEIEATEAEEDLENLKSLIHDLKTALKARENGDVTILLKNDETLTCNRDVLCSRSSFFTNALKPGRFKEGTTGTVEMLEDAPSAIKALIQFLCTAEYKITLPDAEDNALTQSACGPLLHIAEVYVVAAIYDVPQLQRQMLRYLQKLMHICYLPELSTFPRALRRIYDWVPEDECLILQDKDFLTHCYFWIGFDEGVKEELFELVPEFVDYLTEQAWEFVVNDVSKHNADRWIEKIKGPAAGRFDEGWARCPRCSKVVFASFSFKGFGNHSCGECGYRMTSFEWVSHLCDYWDEWKTNDSFFKRH